MGAKGLREEIIHLPFDSANVKALLGNDHYFLERVEGGWAILLLLW